MKPSEAGTHQGRDVRYTCTLSTRSTDFVGTEYSHRRLQYIAHQSHVHPVDARPPKTTHADHPFVDLRAVGQGQSPQLHVEMPRPSCSARAHGAQARGRVPRGSTSSGQRSRSAVPLQILDLQILDHRAEASQILDLQIRSTACSGLLDFQILDHP